MEYFETILLSLEKEIVMWESMKSKSKLPYGLTAEAIDEKINSIKSNAEEIKNKNGKFYDAIIEMQSKSFLTPELSRQIEESKAKIKERECKSEELVIDETQTYTAVIEWGGSYASLSFKDKEGWLVQGEVDNTLEPQNYDGYGYDIATGIGELTIFPDDGYFIISLEDYPVDKIFRDKQKIIDCLKNVYFDNKEKFRLNIESDLGSY
ncbi:MAG: hypothetical protein LBT30_06775 [Clostridiales bacterium]|jgi:hypothetical protein|nr:hypothetical protein [Clostridiales bacterium]